MEFVGSRTEGFRGSMASGSVGGGDLPSSQGLHRPASILSMGPGSRSGLRALSITSFSGVGQQGAAFSLLINKT